MMEGDSLAQGMFWGGLIVASVPILLTVGVGIYLLRRYLRERGEKGEERESRPLEGGPPRTSTS